MSSKPPTVVMLAGLQGSGKTTAAGKLARQLKSQGHAARCSWAPTCSARPPSSSCGCSASSVDVPVFSEPTDPVQVARKGVARGGAPGQATS